MKLITIGPEDCEESVDRQIENLNDRNGVFLNESSVLDCCSTLGLQGFPYDESIGRRSVGEKRVFDQLSKVVETFVKAAYLNNQGVVVAITSSNQKKAAKVLDNLGFIDEVVKRPDPRGDGNTVTLWTYNVTEMINVEK